MAYIVAFAVTEIGGNVFLEPSQFAAREAANFDPRSALTVIKMAQSQKDARSAYACFAAALLLFLLTLPMIWWWLSARRRKDLPRL